MGSEQLRVHKKRRPSTEKKVKTDRYLRAQETRQRKIQQHEARQRKGNAIA